MPTPRAVRQPEVPYCGCEIIDYVMIRWCPLHASTLELLKALQETHEAMSDVFRENKEIGRTYLSSARRRAKEAITAASEGSL